MKTVKTPELNKIAAVKDQSQAIGDFLEWLFAEKRVQLSFYHQHSKSCDGFDKATGQIVPEYECDEGPDHKHDFGMYGCHPRRVFGCDLPCQSLTPFHYTKEKLLAEFFEIDSDKAEKERQAILESLRSGK